MVQVVDVGVTPGAQVEVLAIRAVHDSTGERRPLAAAVTSDVGVHLALALAIVLAAVAAATRRRYVPRPTGGCRSRRPAAGDARRDGLQRAGELLQSLQLTLQLRQLPHAHYEIVVRGISAELVFVMMVLVAIHRLHIVHVVVAVLLLVVVAVAEGLVSPCT